MKYNIILIICISIITAITVDKIEDAFSEISFKERAQEFISAGGRNTAENGVHLCKRVNRLEALAGIKTSNCAVIYKYYKDR